MSDHIDNDQLKFPNGLSVRRAKQRAKSLKKTLGITLGEALQQVAAANGMDKPWSEVIAWLRTHPSNRLAKKKSGKSPSMFRTGLPEEDKPLVEYAASMGGSYKGIGFDVFMNNSGAGLSYAFDKLLETNRYIRKQGLPETTRLEISVDEVLSQFGGVTAKNRQLIKEAVKKLAVIDYPTSCRTGFRDLSVSSIRGKDSIPVEVMNIKTPSGMRAYFKREASKRR